MSELIETPMVFTKVVRVSGGFSGAFVFESDKEADDWIESARCHLTGVYKADLPGLKIGDKCNVLGDGDEVYTIRGLVRYGQHRYGFILDHGLIEEVAKCHTNFIRKEIDRGIEVELCKDVHTNFIKKETECHISFKEDFKKFNKDTFGGYSDSLRSLIDGQSDVGSDC